MSDTVIQVEGVGKKYLLGGMQHDTLRDRLAHALRAPLRLWREEKRAETPADFWALNDVSFSVKRGEVVGLIGRNGAGKSTLLKILSRITEPTTGRVTIKGRVASLLEVGTGFHPELTGRENISLNGAILGMSRSEIRRKFDEIVAFAEVERFIDTPVKHYSSGMYVRLAFAVAAHLDPEILIIDEVLAVGDAAFQKKCLGKMQSVSSAEGRTVLFVSHNLPSIRQLCPTSILLAGGRLQAAGASKQILDLYLRGAAEPIRLPEPTGEARETCYVTEVAMETLQNVPQAIFPVGAPWQIRFRLRAVRRLEATVVLIHLLSPEGAYIQTAWTEPRDLPAGEHAVVFRQNRVFLEAGSYQVYVEVRERDRSIQRFEATRFDLNGENPVGYFPRTFGVGSVLNSMETEILPCSAP